jgi:flagellar protein FliS
MMVGAQAYANTQIQTASSVQVIVLLYDGAISSMRLAQEGMSTLNYQDKARFLDRALRVIGELSASIWKKVEVSRKIYAVCMNTFNLS